MRLKGKRVVVCATGSVASIETPKLARELRRQGAEVHCVMSRAAQRIIHPDVLEWASDHKVVTRLDGECQHVKLCGLVPEKADLVMVAPCTANTIGKIASGIDDTPVTTVVSTAIGSGIPIIIVPAMHFSLYNHPVLQENLKKLAAIGVKVMAPRLEENKAKFPQLEAVLAEADALIARAPGTEKDFEGKRVLVSAGATQEPIDEVRFISNRSSGLMGFALAEEAAERGAEVTLVKGATQASLPPDFKGKVVEALTAREMAAEIRQRAKQADIFLHAAAVSDFSPSQCEGKLDSGAINLIELSPTQKIIDLVKKDNPKIFLVGFKAECTDSVNELVERASRKLAEAKADLICANNVSRKDIGFGAAANEVVMVDRHNQIKILEKKSKREIARKILDEVYALQ